MQFTYVQGGDTPLPQAISIHCVDAETQTTPMDPLAVTLGDTATWLKLTPTTGNTPYNVDVSVIPAGLAPGSYNATITINSTGQVIVNPSETMAVGLTVYAAPDILPPQPTPMPPPTIRFKTANNTTFKGNAPTFTVIVGDPVGVTAVELYVGEAKKALTCQSVHADGQRLPDNVQLHWQEAAIPVGTYLLTAKAYNKAGGVAEAQITVKRI